MPEFTALRVHAATDKISEARFETLTIEQLSAGEVVVRVAWSGINYKDALAVTGRGRIIRSFPRVPGVDLAGHVEHSDDPRYRPGDAVLITGCGIGERLDGGYAPYARVAADALIRKPDGLSLRETMAIGTAGFTAGFALRRMLENHQSPELGPIAITGATGGVGSIAIDLFKRAGFTVHAITGKAGAADGYLKALGADQVIARGALAIGSKPLEAARWGGAVDNLGGETLSMLMRSIAPWGNIASIGLAQSPELHGTVMPFLLRGVSVLGIHSVDCPRPWREAIWAQLAGPWRPRVLDRIVTREVSLQDVPAACEALIAGSMTGRVLVRMSERD